MSFSMIASALADLHDRRGVGDVLRGRAPVAPFAEAVLAELDELRHHRQHRIADPLGLLLQLLEVVLVDLDVLEDFVAGLLRDDLQLGLGAGEAGLEVEILLDAVAVGPHLPHGFGAEDVLEDGGVDGAGGHGGAFQNISGQALHSKCGLARDRERTEIYSGLMPVFATSARHFAVSLRMRAVTACGRAGIGLEALLLQVLDDVGLFQDFVHRAVELGDDGVRRAGRRDIGDPERHVVILDAGLHHGRHVRQRRDALGAGRRQRPQLAVADVLQRRADGGELHVEAAGDDVDRGLRRALVGNVGQLDAGVAGEQRGGEMREARKARRAVVQLAGLGLGERHQLGDAFRRDAGIEHQHIGRGADHRDRLEVVDRVVGQLGAERRRHAMRARGDQADRVAVRRGLGDDIDAEIAAGAGAVLDDELLAELGREFLRHQAADDVGGGAGRERHHDAHRLVRIARPRCANDGEAASSASRVNASGDRVHGASSRARPVMSCSKSLRPLKRGDPAMRGVMMTLSNVSSSSSSATGSW